MPSCASAAWTPARTQPLHAGLVACLLAAGCHFTLDRSLSPGEITGTAVYRSATGALVPAAGARVTLENTALSVTADSRGTFVLSALPAGTYALDLVASAGSGASSQVGLRLANQTVAPQDGLDLGQVVLDRLGAISGTVTVDSMTVQSGAIATIAGLAEAPVMDGAFQFPVLLPGAYQVIVLYPENPGALVSAAVAVQVNPGATARLSIPLSSQANLQMSGSVSGVVTLSGSSEDDGIDVQLSGGGPDATTASGGNWDSTDVPAGVYTVSASLGGYGSVSVAPWRCRRATP